MNDALNLSLINKGENELEAAKMIGAGLAAIALAGAGVGIGIIFGNCLSGAMRNPSTSKNNSQLALGFALAMTGFLSCSFNYFICILNK